MKITLGQDKSEQPPIPEALALRCQEFEIQWAQGFSPCLEDWLSKFSPESHQAAFVSLLKIDLWYRSLQGETISEQDYRRRFTQFSRELDDVFHDQNSISFDESHNRSHSSTLVWGIPPGGVIASPPCVPGDLIERFRLVECVGRGGFGEVWKAFDPELSREVALKFTRPDRLSQAVVDRLRLEAKFAASLKHQNIVPVYDIGSSEQGVYIVSEFIQGETLANRLRRGKPGCEDAVRWIIAIADALHHAHVRGIVHRDIKPANILLKEPNHDAVLTDFGLAVSEVEQLRESPSTMGTWWYMSPEQARGESNRVDARSDIYSLGVVFYQLLTGRLPFIALTREDYLDQLQHRPPRPLRTIDDALDTELEQICLRCLGKNPAERYTTAAEIRLLLDEWVKRQHQGITQAPPAGVLHSKWRNAIAALGALILLVVGFLVAWQLFPPTRTADIQPDEKRPQLAAVIPSRSTPRDNDALPMDSWRPLLRQSPVMFAWPIGDGREMPIHNSNVLSYRVRSDRTRWVATVSDLEPLAFEIRGVLTMNNWVGQGGFVWQLTPAAEDFPKKVTRCLSVHFGRSNEAGTPRLFFQLVKMSERSYDVWEITEHTLDHLDVPVPQGPSAVLMLRVNDEGIAVTFNDGKLWHPHDPLSETTRPTGLVTKIGLTGGLGEVGFRDFELRYLPH